MKINFSPSIGSPPLESVSEIVATLADDQQRRAISKKLKRPERCLYIVPTQGTAGPCASEKPANS